MVYSLYLDRKSSDFDEIFARKCELWFPEWSLDEKSKFSKSKTADGRYIENRFSAISQCHIVWLTRNLEWGSRITCWLLTRHVTKIANLEDSKLRTTAILKMFFSISQQRIVRFRWNLVCRCAVWFGKWSCEQFYNSGIPSNIISAIGKAMYFTFHT